MTLVWRLIEVPAGQGLALSRAPYLPQPDCRLTVWQSAVSVRVLTGWRSPDYPLRIAGAVLTARQRDTLLGPVVSQLEV